MLVSTTCYQQKPDIAVQKHNYEAEEADDDDDGGDGDGGDDDDDNCKQRQ